MEGSVAVNLEKKRSKNFTEREKLSLVYIALGYSHILENKKTDSVSVAEKDKAWNEICIKYNSSSQTGQRTPKQLQALYLFLKKAARKSQIHDKVEAFKTVGGTFTPTLTPVGEKLVDALKPQFQPLENPFDSSAELYGENEDFIQTGDEYVEVMDPITTISERRAAMEMTKSSEGEPSSSAQSFSQMTSQGKSLGREPSSSIESASQIPSRKRKQAEEITELVCSRKNTPINYDAELHAKKCRILDLGYETKCKESKMKLDILEIEKRIRVAELSIVLKKLQNNQ